MSGGLVQVDADALEQLASALSSAFVTVNDACVRVRQAGDRWDVPASMPHTMELSYWCRDQALVMRRRVAFARLAQEQITVIGPGGAGSGAAMVSIPWEPTEQDAALAGHQTQALLVEALAADPHDRAARAELARLSLIVQQFDGDASFASGLYDDQGAWLGQVARWLHRGEPDGVVLSASSRQVLARFSQNLAAATLASGDELDLSGVAAGDDPWSLAMLVANGPSGSGWGLSFLAEATTQVLAWRDTHPTTLVWDPAMYAVSTDPQGGYRGQVDSWYADLGLCAPNGVVPDPQAVLANDPARIFVTAVAANPAAARRLLGGEQGVANAARLLDSHWTVPGFETADTALGTVVTAATTPPPGSPVDQLTATAAVNVLVRASDCWYSDEALPSSVVQAVGGVATRYVDDLAKSATNPRGTSDTASQHRDGSPAWTVVVGMSTLTGALHVVQQDPATWGVFHGVLMGDVTALAQAQDLERLRWYGSLAGVAALVPLAADLDRARESDARNAQAAAYTQAVFALTDAGASLVATAPAAFTATAINNLLGQAAAGAFATDTAAEVAARNRSLAYQSQASFEVPVAQGMLNAGIIEPPTTAQGLHPAWFHDGTLDLTSSHDQAEFHDWWLDVRATCDPARLTEDAAKAGADEQTDAKQGGDDQQAGVVGDGW